MTKNIKKGEIIFEIVPIQLKIIFRIFYWRTDLIPKFSDVKQLVNNLGQRSEFDPAHKSSSSNYLLATNFSYIERRNKTSEIF